MANIIQKGANKRKLTVSVSGQLYNVSSGQLKRLCLTGMSNDGITSRDVEAIGATKLPPPPAPDMDLSTWDAVKCQAALSELLGSE